MKKLKYVILALLAALLLLAAVNHRLTRTLYQNLTAPRLSLDQSGDWESGSALRVYYGENTAQYVDLYVPDTAGKAAPPLFVLVHGGGFISNDAQSRQAQFMYRYFRDRGFACASVNYRLAQEAPYPGACDDVAAAVRFLAAHASAYGYDGEKIAIWGESAGGYLATREALTETEVQISALVSYYGAYDFEAFEPQFREQGIPKWIRTVANYWSIGKLEGFASCEEYWMRKAYSDWSEVEKREFSVQAIAESGMANPELRVLLVAGTADITVPPAQTLNLAAALEARYGADAVSLILREGLGHADDRLYSEELLAEVEAFLREALGA